MTSALVLAAGMPGSWAAGSGVTIENLRTPHGPLSYTLMRDAGRLVLPIGAGLLRIRRLPAEVVVEEREPERPATEDFSVWEAEIRTFEKAADEHPEPENAVVFVGSSSINLWSSLKDDMSPIPVIQRGFGGSTLGAVAHYAERLVNVHKPRAVVVFAGSNDITPERVLAPDELLQRYRRFVGAVRAELPEVPIYYIAITPSPSRWTVWSVAKRANELIEGYSSTVDGLYMIDFTRQLLGPNGQPDPKYYQADGLHMSEAGYEIWKREIRRRLLRDLPHRTGHDLTSYCCTDRSILVRVNTGPQRMCRGGYHVEHPARRCARGRRC
ncbi:MAG: GDSL-type esterase/lipase family protein [Gammaproteobacteria bacterium]